MVSQIITPPGGGGGGPTIYPVTTSGFASGASLRVDDTGYLQGAAQLKTVDGKVTLDLADRTRMLTAGNNALTSFSVSAVASPPAVLSGNALVLAYNFGPEGAKFNPGIKLTMKYDPAALPTGVAEKDLYIAYYDGSQWQILTSTVDTTNKTVSATLTHFSQYALIGKVTPPAATTPAVTTPVVTTPAVTTPAVTTPAVTTPAVTTPAVTTPAVTTPAATTPAATTPAVTTPATTTPGGGKTQPLAWWLITIIVVVALIIVLVVILQIRRRKN
jgi:hypothetical protein